MNGWIEKSHLERDAINTAERIGMECRNAMHGQYHFADIESLSTAILILQNYCSYPRPQQCGRVL
jgi:hypothetical protein